MVIELLMLGIAWAEPGHLKNPEIKVPPKPKYILKEDFERSKGLSPYELRGLHYSRVSCARRVFTPSGQSLEGDGDLKVTQIGVNYVEVDFPSKITFSLYGARNPFKNDVSDIDSDTSRSLVPLRHWQDGETLKFTKNITVHSTKRTKLPEQLTSDVEVRVLPDSYPPLFIVRQRFHTNPAFTAYFLCE